jgi:hypothetical protein
VCGNQATRKASPCLRQSDAWLGAFCGPDRTTIILGVADAAARRELEALMASPKFRSTFVDGLLQQGEEKGLLGIGQSGRPFEIRVLIFWPARQQAECLLGS